MLSTWVKKLVLAAALAVMPVQGIAGTLAVLLCHGDAQAHVSHATAAGHAEGHGEHATAHTHDALDKSEEGNGGNLSLFHLCCNLAASIPPSVTVNSELPRFPVKAFAPASLHDLFVPEQPQRPPLV